MLYDLVPRRSEHFACEETLPDVKDNSCIVAEQRYIFYHKIVARSSFSHIHHNAAHTLSTSQDQQSYSLPNYKFSQSHLLNKQVNQLTTNNQHQNNTQKVMYRGYNNTGAPNGAAPNHNNQSPFAETPSTGSSRTFGSNPNANVSTGHTFARAPPLSRSNSLGGPRFTPMPPRSPPVAPNFQPIEPNFTRTAPRYTLVTPSFRTGEPVSQPTAPS